MIRPRMTFDCVKFSIFTIDAALLATKIKAKRAVG